MSDNGNVLRALGSGIAGALALTVVHEVGRRVLPHAPRMDRIGMRALRDAVRMAGGTPAHGRRLYRQTLLGDLLGNALYYSLAGSHRSGRSLRRGLLLGAAAGLGAVLLPPVLGLGRSPGAKAPVTPLLTVAWYTVGGLAAATARRALEPADPQPA